MYVSCNWLKELTDFSYTTEELVNLIADVKTTIPRYCRVNRVIRDIPSDNVVEGKKRTSLRQDVHNELKRRGQKCECIRCREVRGKPVDPDQLVLDDLIYQTDAAEEHFISWVTPDDGELGALGQPSFAYKPVGYCPVNCNS